MTTVTQDQAQAELPTLLHEMAVGAELVITENGLAAAKIQRLGEPTAKHGPQFGFAMGWRR